MVAGFLPKLKAITININSMNASAVDEMVNKTAYANCIIS